MLHGGSIGAPSPTPSPAPTPSSASHQQAAEPTIVSAASATASTSTSAAASTSTSASASAFPSDQMDISAGGSGSGSGSVLSPSAPSPPRSDQSIQRHDSADVKLTSSKYRQKDPSSPPPNQTSPTITQAPALYRPRPLTTLDYPLPSYQAPVYMPPQPETLFAACFQPLRNIWSKYFAADEIINTRELIDIADDPDKQTDRTFAPPFFSISC